MTVSSFADRSRSPHRGLFGPLLAGFFLILTPHPGGARTVQWASDTAPQPEGSPPVNFDSNGLALDLSFTIEFGGFDDGFVPTLSNLDQWIPHWHPLGEATHEPLLSYYFGEEEVADNSVFAAGQQMYLWVYNTPPDASTSQWALITDDSGDGITGDNWNFPAVSGAPGESTVTFLATLADLPLFGAVNGLRGAGGFLAEPETFLIQTHEAPYAMPSPIPEPSLAALLLAGIALVRRRRPSGT